MARVNTLTPWYAGAMPTQTAGLPVLVAEVFPRADPLLALAGLPGAFALRSSLPDAGAAVRRARWSYFGADPFASFRGDDPATAMAVFREVAASARTVAECMS